jgi:hypothetical protein
MKTNDFEASVEELEHSSFQLWDEEEVVLMAVTKGMNLDL